MAGSVDALAGALGDAVVTRARVDSVARAPSGYAVRGEGIELHAPVCVLAPPQAAGQMLRGLDAAWPTASRRSPPSPSRRYLGFDHAAVPPDVDGFGFLAPQGELGSVLGAIYTSSVFPHQAPEGSALFRVMSGGHAYPHEVERSDEQLVEQASDVLRNLLGIYQRPTFRYVSRARAAIPQYVHGHSARMQAAAAGSSSTPG